LEKLAGRQVRFTGWVSRDELYNLFRGARAFVYPSRFEGFGMPVLEAMAARVPVACSDIPPLREIADGCAIFFDPTNLKQMRQAILRSLEDDSLVDAAQQRAAQYTWENAALATLDYLRRSSN
jgi:glycosyltransferase involved in cell wall biosynthesis